MTREEAIKMLKAKLECMTRDVSGCDDDCNRKLCNECHLNYEQGNMGEQKEYLRMSIEALEQEPKEITFDDVQKYCRARCLTIITDELLFELTHQKLLPQKSEV